MLFNSLEFLILMSVLIPVYFSAKTTLQQHIILLIGSLFFYAWWSVPFLSLLLLSAATAALVGELLNTQKLQAHRKAVLIVGVVVNLSILSIFKYYNFFIELLGDMSVIQLRYAELILPLGISFYTFQSLSYMIDVYRGQLHAEKRAYKVLLYIAFFPQLVAGPIVRATHFLPQLVTRHKFCYDDLMVGGQRVLIGLLKKVVIADNIAQLVDPVYANPSEYSGLALLIASYAFAIQIYCDFSGYSDMAIGIARMLGFRLNENFNLPYISQSIQEFWRRWHISLSTWLRDYLYIPLGGSKFGRLKTYRNLIITMLLGGLWHGASYNFIVWGGIHGVWLAIERYFSKEQGTAYLPSFVSKTPRSLRIFLVFHGVCVSWIFFRAESLRDAGHVLQGIASWQTGMQLPLFLTAWQVGLITLVSAYIFLRPTLNNSAFLQRTATAFAVLAIIVFGASSSEFIYFVF